jgi:hypothetical protein
MGKLEDFYEQAKTNAALKAEIDALEGKYADHPSKRILTAKATIAIAEKYGVLLDLDDFNAPMLDWELESVSGGGVVPALPTCPPAVY